MALRSPTESHSFWGAVSTLPSGPAVQVGDTVFDTSPGVNRLKVCTSIGPVTWADAAITQLTQDVLAGPGAGSLAATVVGLQGQPVSAVVPSLDGQVLTWNGSEWVPGAPASGGSGGGGQVYFLNSAPASSPGVLPIGTKQLSITAEGSPGSSVTVATNPSWVTVAEFVTDPGVPGTTVLPAGLWDFNIWASAVATPNQVSFRIGVYKYDGSPLGLPLATSTEIPLFDPTSLVQYVASAILPQTILAVTDRIYVLVEAKATGGMPPITLNLGYTTPSHVHTTLPSISGTGIPHVLNGVVQSFASPINFAAGPTEITGTLPIGNGGTGGTTAPVAGQILQATSGSVFAPATLVAGSGASISNVAGTITISATGSGGTVTNVTAAAPLASSGGPTPNISLTGIVPISNGGTNLSATPSSGQVLIGNGTGYTLNNLAAGANIAIGNSPGSITITASSGGGAWTTLLDVDFSAQTSAPYNVATTYTIGGYSFRRSNISAPTDNTQIINTRGMVFNPPSGTNFQYYGNGAAEYNAQKFDVSLGGLGLSMQTPLRVTMLIGTESGMTVGAPRGSFVSVENQWLLPSTSGATPRDGWVHNRQYLGGPVRMSADYNRNGTPSSYPYDPDGAVVYKALRLVLPAGIAARSVEYCQAPLPSPPAVPSDSAFTAGPTDTCPTTLATSVLQRRSIADWCVSFGAVTANSGTLLTVDIVRLVIEARL